MSGGDVGEPRLVGLDGPANFRDLGGFDAADGRVTRAGVLFRSDSLSYLSDADVAHLRDRLGIRTVVDMRAANEVAEFGHGPLAEHVRQLHLPIVDQSREPPTSRFRPRRVARFQTLEQIYVFMVDEYRERFGAVVQVVADPDRHPLVFHCAAGKDRTGIITALVLSVCGVSDVDIVADFAYTERRMPEIIARHVVRAERTDVPPEVASQQYGAQPVAMEATLAHLRDAYGSVEGYLAAAGVDAAAVRRMRDSLLADPTDPTAAP